MLASSPGALHSDSAHQRHVVLVVDDQPDVRELYRVNLELAGYEVVEAADGAHAVDAIWRDRQPDAILLDLMMPGMDGWQVLETLRNDEAKRHIPVVVLTACASGDDQARSFSAGASEYVCKPFHPRTIVNVIERALALRCPRDGEADGARHVPDDPNLPHAPG